MHRRIIHDFKRSYNSKNRRSSCKAGYIFHPESKRIQKPYNPKSLLGVLALGIDKGMTFKITANGADEEDAVNALVHLVTSNFEE